MGRRVAGWSALVALTVAVGAGAASRVAAQDAAVVLRLVGDGRMPAADARRLVQAVSQAMADNAARGGTDYDRMRQVVGRAIYGSGAGGGPGRTPEEFHERLARVLGALQAGLDERALDALFAPLPNGAVLCAEELGVTLMECDALIAAASRQPAALSFMPPDEGQALVQSMDTWGAAPDVAAAVVTDLRAAMLGVPRNLSNDAIGRARVGLLEACPGGLRGRESQVRAWHAGPTEGMSRCIARAVASRGGRSAPAMASDVLGMQPDVALAFLRWGTDRGSAPPPESAGALASPASRPWGVGGTGRSQGPPAAEMQRVSPPAPPAPPPPSVDGILVRARQHFQAGRLRQAYAAYEEAARVDPRRVAAFAGMGAVRLRAADARGAISAYEHAIELEGNVAALHVSLGDAYVAARDRDRALAAYRRAMELDAGNGHAREAVARLSIPREADGAALPRVPPPPLPEVPPRDVILNTLRAIQPRVASCAPAFDGVVLFSIKISGETGYVSEATIEGELASSPEGECMAGIVRGASFPRFTRESLDVSYPFQI